MKKNEDIVKDFCLRIESSNRNLTSVNNKLFSYQTCIAEFVGDNFRLILNTTNYSVTTSRHQNLLRRMLSYYNILDFIEVNSIPRGTQSLLRYAV